MLRYGDTVEILDYENRVLTPVTVDGTLSFADRCSGECTIKLLNPDDRTDLNGLLKSGVAFQRPSDGAWLTIVSGGSEMHALSLSPTEP